MNEMQRLARNIAAELSGEWHRDDSPREDGAALRGPNGERLWLNPGAEWIAAERGKLAIHGDLSDLREHLRYNEPHHGIRVAMSKRPAVIAREIERRLLPDYRIARDQASERKTAHDAAMTRRNEILDELQGILGGRRFPRDEGKVRFPGLFNEADALYDGHEIEFRLRLSDADALRLARWLADNVDLNREL